MNDIGRDSTAAGAGAGGRGRAGRMRRGGSWLILGGGGLAVLLGVDGGTGLAARGHGAVTPAQAGARVERAARAQKPRIEVVFALDTTGSMSGLIDGAKRKVWSIASFIARGQPQPELRVGLVAYRDIGDEYVTRLHDLDGDLDAVYRDLLSFQAAGGGDGPEHVARALSESVNRMSWSDGQGVLRMVYLVGDAPGHTDYQDGFSLEKAAADAARKGIQLHAIRCGGDGETEAQWRKVAALGRGEFLTIGQDGGMVATRTPYDDEMAKLHDKLSATVMGYGAGRAKAAEAVAAAAPAPVEAKAERAAFLAATKQGVAAGEHDLVQAVEGGKGLGGIPKDDLPAEIRNLPPAAQEAAVAAKVKERREVMGRLDRLASERDDYLKKHADAAGSGFDTQVRKTVAAGAAGVGVKY